MRWRDLVVRGMTYAASRAGLWEMVTLALAGLLLARPPDDPDMWWHLANGRYIAQHGRIPTRDPFSFTRAGAPWVNAFWLSDWLAYRLWRWGGWTALAVGALLVGAALALLLLRRTPGPYPLRAALVLAAFVPSSALWRPRPQLASFLLLAVLDALLARPHWVRRAWWWLPLFFALWANLHGGFSWGFLLLLAVGVGEAVEARWGAGGRLSAADRRALAWGSGLAVWAVLLNPNGAALWRLPFYTVQVSLRIQEWASPDFHRPDLHPVLWLLFVLVLGLAWFGRRLPLDEILKTLGFAYMAFVAVRAVVPFVVIAVPAVGRALAPANPSNASMEAQTSRTRLWPRAVLHLSLFALLLGVVGARVAALSRPEVVHRAYPQGAVAYLQRVRPPGRLYNDYNWGGYLIWNLPAYPVFVDGRADLYGQAGLDLALRIANAAPETSRWLADYGVRLVLVPPERPVAQALLEQGWRVLYRDEQAVLLGR